MIYKLSISNFPRMSRYVWMSIFVMTVAGINARVAKLLSVSCGRRWIRLGRKEKAVSLRKFALPLRWKGSELSAWFLSLFFPSEGYWFCPGTVQSTFWSFSWQREFLVCLLAGVRTGRLRVKTQALPALLRASVFSFSFCSRAGRCF